ncbi:MAG: hypothetical protein ACJ8HJ_07075 [Massilia sp.]
MSAFALIASGTAAAIGLSGDETLTLTGFYNLTGAKVLGSPAPIPSPSGPFRNRECPCFVAAFEYASIYEKGRGFTFDQESLLGIQIRKEFSSTLSVTSQLVSRTRNPNEGSRPTVDWLYVTWRPSTDSGWTVQLGKMRIPLFYYSDQLYVSYAYPWVRPPEDVYGLPIYAYNGINANYRTQLGSSDWASTVTVWSGNYTQENDAYRSQVYLGKPTNESWERMLGGSVSIANDVLDIRAIIMRMNDSIWQVDPDGLRTTLVDSRASRVVGVSANMDYKNWLVKSEVQRTDGGIGRYNYGLLGIGYQLGAWTPMYTFSRYRNEEQLDIGSTHTASLRWDFHKDITLKFQYELANSRSHYNLPISGKSRLLSVSLGGIF